MANKTKNAKKTKKAKSSRGADKALTSQRQRNHGAGGGNRVNGQKLWQVIVRLIIVALLVLALGSSLFFGITASAYSLPLQQTQARVFQQNPLLAQAQVGLPQIKTEENRLSSFSQQAYAPQPGDRIDGRPAEDYTATAQDLPTVVAPMAALSTKDGRILFERNIDEPVSMASTTKMMTAMIALENLSLDDQLTVTYGAANTDGTDSGLEEGIVISLLDCLYALLIPSGNDAAVVIAENVSGMEMRFTNLMNAKAAELGMTSTHFADASGLSDDNHYTTVRDFLILTRYCMENNTFREIVATGAHEIQVGNKVLELEPTDLLGDYLTQAQNIGIKTGYTDQAGYCFVGAATLSGVEVYSIVFNAPTTEQRFTDSANLLEWGLRHYRTIELINTTQQVADVALLSWIDKTVAAYVSSTVRVDLFDLNGPITQEININDIKGEATKGKSCGEMIWSQNGEVLITAEVVAAETVLSPDFWEGLGIGWTRFWGGFSEEPEHAETIILLKRELAIPAPSAQQTTL